MSASRIGIESRLDPDARIAAAYAEQHTTDLLVLAFKRATRRGSSFVTREDILAAHEQLTTPVSLPSRGRRFVILFAGGFGAAMLEIGLDDVLKDKQPNWVFLIGVLLAAWAVWQQVTLGER
jgi:hypothetical protein